MNEHIYAFLVEWLAWAEGHDSEIEYYMSSGLCHNFNLYRCFRNLGGHERDRFETLLSVTTRHQMDTDPSYDYLYPFGGFDLYEKEKFEGIQHKNPARLAWVRERIAEWEERQLEEENGNGREA